MRYTENFKYKIIRKKNNRASQDKIWKPYKELPGKYNKEVK